MASASRTKRWAKKALVRSYVLTGAARWAPSSVVILMYHSVVEKPELTKDIVGLSKSEKVFEAHMKALHDRFAPVGIEEVIEFINTGRKPPYNAVAVTFDDGFADNYDVALPILDKYRIPATFYIMVNAVNTGDLPWFCRLRFALNTTNHREWVDPESHHTYEMATWAGRQSALLAALQTGARKTGVAQGEFVRQTEKALEVEPPDTQHRYMLTWEKVRALRKAGHTIGGHTLSHPNLAQVSLEAARSEIVGCKKTLEKEIGEVLDHFSYPHPALNPQWSKQTSAILREAGFKSAVVTTCGPVHAKDYPLTLKRIYAANDLDQWMWNLQSTYLGRAV